MAEQQRRGTYVGLAFASALVVLIASGVAISRVGDDDGPSRSSETASPVPAPESTTSDSPAAAQDPGTPPADATDASEAASSTPAPVPPPVPARKATRPGAGQSEGAAGSSDAAPEAKTAAAPSDQPAPSPAPKQDGSDQPESGEGSSPPAPQRDPESSAVLMASASVGEGAGGAVVGAGLGDSPDADLTVGDTHVVGDAPPSNGTGIGLGGSILRPPPTIPLLPG